MTKEMIQVDLTDFTRSVKQIVGRDYPRHVVNGLAEVAKVASEDVGIMTRSKFKLHTDYILKGIRHTPRTSGQKGRAVNALKRYGDFNAAVYLRPSNSPANSLEFMAHHEWGEERQPQDKYIAIPMAGLRSKAYKTSRGRIRKRWKPANLLAHFKTQGSSFDGRTTTNKGMSLGPRKRRVPGTAFIIQSRAGSPMIVRRINRTNSKHGGELEFMYILKKQARIDKHWDFVDTTYRSVRNNYSAITIKHLNRLSTK